LNYPVVGELDRRQGILRLTETERASGRLAKWLIYRLPKDEEWSVAVGLDAETGYNPHEKDGKIKGVYPWGTTWIWNFEAGVGGMRRKLKARPT
jgi:hypothetical protein